jgi:hypothetical protein
MSVVVRALLLSQPSVLPSSTVRIAHGAPSVPSACQPLADGWFRIIRLKERP